MDHSVGLLIELSFLSILTRTRRYICKSPHTWMNESEVQSEHRSETKIESKQRPKQKKTFFFFFLKTTLQQKEDFTEV